MAEVENAIQKEASLMLASVDYYKFFDSFDFDFVKCLFAAHGLPDSMVQMHHDLYSNL